MKNLLLLASLLCLHFRASAQLYFNPTFQHVPPERIGVDRAYGQCFAKDGSMWAGSIQGLVHFNGYTSKVYKFNTKDKNCLMNDSIQALFMDSQENLWIAYLTKSGISRFNTKTEKFTHFLPDSTKKDAIPDVPVVLFKEDKKGNIWIATWGSGLVRLDPVKKTFKVYKYDGAKPNDPGTVAANQVKSFTPWKNDKYLIGYFADGSHSSIPSVYNIKTDQFSLFPINEYLANIDKGEAERIAGYLRIVHFIHVDKNENIWIGTYSGLVFLNTREKKAYRVSARQIDQSLGNIENTRSFVEDHEGRLWVATAVSGILVIDPDRPLEAINLKMQLNNVLALQDNRISTMVKDKDDNIWISTGAGGFAVYSPIHQQFDIHPWDRMELTYFDASWQQTPVMEMHIDRDGTVYVSSANGLVAYDHQARKIVDHIYPLNDKNFRKGDVKINHVFDFRIQPDRIWITNEGPLEIYDRKTKKQSVVKGEYVRAPHFKTTVSNAPLYLREDLWNKIYIYNESTQKAELFHQFPDTVVLPGIEFILSDGRLLCQEDNRRLVVFDPESKAYKVFRINRKGYVPNSSYYMVLCPDNGDDFFIGTESGLYTFNAQTGAYKLLNKEFGLKDNEAVMSVAKDRFGVIWIALQKELVRYDPKKKESYRIGANLGFKPGGFVPYKAEKDDLGRVYFITIKGMLFIDPAKIEIPNRQPDISVSSLVVNEDTVSIPKLNEFKSGKLHLDYDENFLTVEVFSNQLFAPNLPRIHYRLVGLNDNWQDNGVSNRIRFTNLSYGNYVLEVKAINSFNVTSNVLRIRFTIARPFWLAWWFYCILAILLTFIIWMYIRWREKAMRLKQEMLEQKIAERTAEVVAKAKEIELQKDIIEVKNKELTDSIYYAKRIQLSILPDENIIRKHLPQHFIYYRPKDIVSGDFYWFAKKDNYLLWAVVDCTGHGVPGGFMSMLGAGLLNQIVNEENHTSPEEVLNMLRDRVIIALRQTGAEGESRDGMDISFCRYDKTNKTIEYAGANHTAYIIRNNNLHELKGNKQPIGIYVGERKSFTKERFELLNNDHVYFSSDGYADQFGGEKGKKFKTSNFEKLLLMMVNKPIEEQYAQLDEVFTEWKGDFEQLDDVCVFGVKIDLL